VENPDLAPIVDACRPLKRDRFPDHDHDGAAAMLLDNGTILTDTAPDAINPSVEVCHET
jgi:cytidine deaminase